MRWMRLLLLSLFLFSAAWLSSQEAAPAPSSAGSLIPVVDGIVNLAAATGREEEGLVILDRLEDYSTAQEARYEAILGESKRLKTSLEEVSGSLKTLKPRLTALEISSSAGWTTAGVLLILFLTARWIQ